MTWQWYWVCSCRSVVSESCNHYPGKTKWKFAGGLVSKSLMSSAADRDARKPSNWKKCQKYKINWGVNE